MSYKHRWPTIQKWQELLGQHRKFETIPIWSQPYFYMLVIHRQETTHREKLKHFPRAKLLSNLHSLSYNQTFLSHKPLQNLFTQTLQEPSTEPTQHTIFDLMHVFICTNDFYFKSSQTAPQRNRPTSSRTAMCGHWWCQALVEHAKLCSFWLLCESYDIWHMTYVYIVYLYLHISIFIFYSRHMHIYADISQNMSTIFICVVVERSSSFAGSRRYA